MNYEEPHASITGVLKYGLPMRLKPSGLGSSGQVGSVQAVHAPLIARQEFTHHRLC